MKLLCISASNIQHDWHESTSGRACGAIAGLAMELTQGRAATETIALSQYELTPCVGCGGCFESGECWDDAFGALYVKIKACDGLFIVSPHYAPIPAKLCMVLEKLEEIAFLRWFHDSGHRPAAYGKPVGIVAHGGNDDQATRPAYGRLVLDPIADALRTAMFTVVEEGGNAPNGTVFLPDRFSKGPDSPFPVQTYDWERIREELRPLVAGVVARAVKSSPPDTA